jgi:hypothetical protein
MDREGGGLRTSRSVCVKCILLRYRGQAPYGGQSACAQRAAYPPPPPRSPSSRIPHRPGGLYRGSIARAVSGFGLWSKVFLDYVGLRKALRAVIRMRASQAGAWQQRSPSLPLQCRQCRSRGRDLAPDMQVRCGM